MDPNHYGDPPVKQNYGVEMFGFSFISNAVKQHSWSPEDEL